PSSSAATTERARPAVRLQPCRPRRDPPRRRDHSHRTPAHGGAGRLGGDLLLRLPTRVARGSPPIQRGRRLMVRYVRLLQLFFRTELQYELEYRLHLVLEITHTAVVTGTSVAAILVLFSYTTLLTGG